MANLALAWGLAHPAQSPSITFRVDVGMQVARALPPHLQATQQLPPSCPGAPEYRHCTKVSKSLLTYVRTVGSQVATRPSPTKVYQC